MPASTDGHLSSTTQQYLEVADITNDLLILRDASTALVLEVSAINFGLLSEPEQDAIIYAYAALINSLSFPMQIVISSRPKDVSTYLEFIETQYQSAPSDMRRQQIAAYRQFVANLITEQNVLDKRFFVVLPMSALELGVAGSANPVGVLVPNNKPVEYDKASVIERSLTTLGPRRDHMIAQFGRIGLKARQLATKELIHLFYILYNSQAAEGIKVVNTEDYTTSVMEPENRISFTPGGTPATPPTAPTTTTPIAAPAPQPTSPMPPVSAAPAPAPAPSAPQPLNTSVPHESLSLGQTASPATAPVPTQVAAPAPAPVTPPTPSQTPQPR